MRTLSSELAPVAERVAAAPRVYADANIPAGLVSFMRSRLHWDVLFVIEHDDLRRAADLEHFRTARRLHRTLITLDRDYLDDRRFPLVECAGVLVVSAPDERLLAKLLSRVDRALFRPRSRRRANRTAPAEANAGTRPALLPLEGRKLHVHPDWAAERARR